MSLVYVNLTILKQAQRYRKNIVCYYSVSWKLSEKMKRILKDYDISTQFTPVNALKNAPIHPSDKQKKRRQSDVVYEICCNPNIACHEAYIDVIFLPLQHSLKQHCPSYGENHSAVFNHVIRIDIKLMSMM